MVHKFWRENKDGFEVPIVGGPVIPLSASGEAAATRHGMDPEDKTTPFVENRLDRLFSYYHYYQRSRAAQEWLAYGDLVALNSRGIGFSDGLDVSKLVVEREVREYVVPVSLYSHRAQAEALFKAIPKLRKSKATGEWENELSARVSSFDAGKGVIKIQPAKYFQQVGSNLTVDWASGALGRGKPKTIATIRNLIEPPVEGRLPSLEASCLANTLGVAVVLATGDDRLLVPIRGDNQAIMSGYGGRFHCSASGVFHWNTPPSESDRVGFDSLTRGIQREINRELGLESSEFQVFALAFGRELPRAGKPQLFFGATTSLELGEIKERMTTAVEAWEFLSEENLPPESPLRDWLDRPEDIPPDRRAIERCFTFEGWAALKIMSAYLRNTTIF